MEVLHAENDFFLFLFVTTFFHFPAHLGRAFSLGELLDKVIDKVVDKVMVIRHIYCVGATAALSLGPKSAMGVRLNTQDNTPLKSLLLVLIRQQKESPNTAVSLYKAAPLYKAV